ncbi:spore germination protein [Metasolibacillus sp.]|uniref:spore germination protein n=1 Tax=Metasolibacillus sp. TaxID=2703680 RepID=UPI0025EEC6A4|nr:spore germination protein [Metasolibacillus sp.]MCT6925038.1 spore germination protein [Metasolibacillus sp.]MCT6941269.1 spore germination protein [Metasolibacillus sp.]
MKGSNTPHRADSELSPNAQPQPLFTSLSKTIDALKQATGHSNDVMVRQLLVGKSAKQSIALIYIDGLVNKEELTNTLLERLTGQFTDEIELNMENTTDYLKQYCLTIGDIQEIKDFAALYRSLFNGSTIILLDGVAVALAASMKDAKDRPVMEPAAESVIRGPREAFTETLRTNTALIRRKIKNPNLWIQTKVIGSVTQTDVAIVYINGIVNDKVVKEVLARLDKIEIDGILEGGYIESLIQDAQFTLFPTMYNTERPDVIAAELLEGKVAILVDGTPFVLIVPALITSFLQSSEDYYSNVFVSSFIRILRIVAIGISLIAPSFYVAITTFHHEMLPTPMLISIASQREGVPFPAVIEALIMEIAFEILREAGLRMPRTIGPAVSIVGTLVIGQAAVEAGVVSAVTVIIVALTAICSFLFPSYGLSNSIRILRFPFILLAGGFGLFGVMIATLALVLHLCSLRSFGVPYLSPFAPLILEDQKDAVLLFPRKFLTKRPRLVSQSNPTRATKYERTFKR